MGDGVLSKFKGEAPPHRLSLSYTSSRTYGGRFCAYGWMDWQYSDSLAGTVSLEAYFWRITSEWYILALVLLGI